MNKVLTERDRDIMDMVSKGYTLKTIAEKYNISPERVRQINAHAYFVTHNKPYHKYKDTKNYVLTDDEYNALQYLTCKTKEDCWFWLIQRKGVDMVQDLEEGRVMSLRSGLQLLAEAINGTDTFKNFDFTKRDKEALSGLFKKFNIYFEIPL